MGGQDQDLPRDGARFGVHFQNVSVLDVVNGVSELEEHETCVESVAVEDAGKAVAHHDRNACAEDGDGGVLARGTAAEVAAGNQNVAGLDLLDPLWVKASHAFFTQDFGIPGHEIDSGDDCVRIDMVADLADSTFVQHVTS